MRLPTLAVLIAAVLITSFAAGQSSPSVTINDLGLEMDRMPHQVDGFAGTVRGLWRDGRVFIAGQPDREAFERFKEIGVTVVVNLRTPAEMARFAQESFNEALVVTGFGMEYVHIALGSADHPYTPEAVARFAAVLERHKGPVLLHCSVGWRASYLWSALLVEEHELSLDQAMDRGRAMAIGELPIEGFLGREVEIVFSEPS